MDQASSHPVPIIQSAQGKARLPSAHREDTSPSCHLSPGPFLVVLPLYQDVSLSLFCPTLEPGFFGAIFPSSLLSCEHPGIRQHVVSVFIMVPGSQWSLGGYVWPVGLKARCQEGALLLHRSSTGVLDQGTDPNWMYQGTYAELGGKMLPEHLLCVRDLS